MGGVLSFALLAALNPTLLAATTVMLLLPHPGRLMLGYWLGAMFVSVTLGLVIVFALEGSSVVSTIKHTLSPIADFVLAGVMLVLAVVLATGRPKRDTERIGKRERKRREDGKPPKWQQQLRRGNVTTTFVIGAALSLPGGLYLVGLDRINELDYSTTATVLVVIGFNVIQLLLIEVPILALKIAPTRTPLAIEHMKQRSQEHWRRYAAWGLLVVAAALVIKGIVAAT